MHSRAFFRAIWLLLAAFALAACQTMPTPLQAGLTPAQVAALQAEGFAFTEDGQSMALDLHGRMLFEVDSFDIREDTLAVIDRVTQTLLTLGIERVRLDGHADNSGTPQHNLALSMRRAQAVADAMVVRGFDASAIEVRALGASRPVADNATEEGRSANRRVSLVVRGNAS